jgi:NDP-sugar pyrophosphorylase family protein
VIGYILAAGLGTRLYPLTNHLPKALVPLCGVPLIQHAWSFLRRNGIMRIGANAHYMADKLIESGSSLCPAMPFFHESGFIRGTGGAIHFARDFLSEDEFFCIVNVDIVTDADLKSIAADFIKSDCIAALVAAPSRGAGTVRFDVHTQEYAGTAREAAHGEGLASADFIGIALYRREFLKLLTSDDFSVTGVWRRARENGLSVKVFVKNDIYWNDLGTPGMLALAHFDVLDRKLTGIDVAVEIEVDYELPAAFPCCMKQTAYSALGAYSWCGSAIIGNDVRLERAIILDGSSVADGFRKSNVIITPWEEINFGGSV